MGHGSETLLDVGDDSSASTTKQASDCAVVREQSRLTWQAVCMHQDMVGLLLAITMLAVLWFTFRHCKACVLVVFITSSMLCMRLPYLQVVFWPSLLILILNMHVLRGIHVKVDVPVGQTIDNMWRPE